MQWECLAASGKLMGAGGEQGEDGGGRDGGRVGGMWGAGASWNCLEEDQAEYGGIGYPPLPVEWGVDGEKVVWERGGSVGGEGCGANEEKTAFAAQVCCVWCRAQGLGCRL